MTSKELINNILNKSIIPTKLYKSNLAYKPTIEIETINGSITLLFKSITERDLYYNLLDIKVFHVLTFNPNNLTLNIP